MTGSWQKFMAYLLIVEFSHCCTLQVLSVFALLQVKFVGCNEVDSSYAYYVIIKGIDADAVTNYFKEVNLLEFNKLHCIVGNMYQG